MNNLEKYDEQNNVSGTYNTGSIEVDTYLEELKNTPILSEEDFYPPEDDRYFVSGVYDIEGGDNFFEYSEWYHECYAEWIEE